MASFKDKEGYEWYPVLDALVMSDWTRATGLKLELFTDGEHFLQFPTFALVEAMWYSCRHQVREEFCKREDRPDMGREEFLQRFRPVQAMLGFEAIIVAFNEGLPTEDELPPVPEGAETETDPLPESQPETPSDGET